MTKIIEINECGQCPYYLGFSLKGYCKHLEIGEDFKYICKNEHEIFEHCPLPDKEENGFMNWLDELIESMALDEEASNMATHEHHEYLGIIRGLQIVKDKTEELGL